ncbi:MAG: GTP cyclohydrolase I FolE2 [Bacteroidetes bacterium]|nr:GTP cyclohydrolase I FolE2 [Bacteroidota bacterium]
MSTQTLKRFYDPTFTISPEYRASLPDLQNGPASNIEGANVPIQQVGISNFKLPLTFETREGKRRELEVSIDGYVSLDADKKGINMSRIMRSFYKFKNDLFTFDTLDYILEVYKQDLGSKESFLKLNFNYPMLLDSLRSGMSGYQYYSVALEAYMDERNKVRKFMHLVFEYSSACPCSYELAEHARTTRNIAAIPHSQRSEAYLTVELNGELHIEDLVELAREAMITETQVLVKREDEQAFAELNGAYQKFVEDAARLFYEKLNPNKAIKDFVVRCIHMESLHSHDAVSRISKGIPCGLR